MTTEISRNYNFVDDKNSAVPITASRVDTELNTLVTAVNKKIVVKATAPSSPEEGMFWYDSTNKIQKVYRNGAWQIVGYWRGANIVSATALTLGNDGNVFHVTGTTAITSIATLIEGPLILIFDGALTFTDGNNLKLAGNFSTSADDVIHLFGDGTNYYEISRSAN